MSAELRGRITGIFNFPVSGVEVEIDNGQYRKTLTDANGRYTFEHIEVADWIMGLTPPPKTAYQKTIKTLSTHEGYNTLDVRLTIKPVVKVVGVVGVTLLIGLSAIFSRRR